MPRPLTGYPTSWGNKRASVVGHAGPASYTQMTTGTIPVTGGDTVEAAEFGMKFFDGVFGMLSDDGTHLVQIVPVVESDDHVAGGSGTTAKLRWVVVATGAEAAGAADLSGQVVRLLAIGAQ